MPPSKPAHSMQVRSRSASVLHRWRLGNLPFSRRVRVGEGSNPADVLALDHTTNPLTEIYGRFPMKVSEAMTRDVRVANPDQTLREVARIMADLDTGVMPVGENDRLVG